MRGLLSQFLQSALPFDFDTHFNGIRATVWLCAPQPGVTGAEGSVMADCSFSRHVRRSGGEKRGEGDS
jgi:hypothetical protein